MNDEHDIEIDRLRQRITDVYNERDLLAAALAATLGEWTVELDERHQPVLLFNLPDAGQVSFHVAFDYRQIEGFGITLDDNGEWAGVTDNQTWDGHTKTVAIERLREYIRHATASATAGD